MLCDVESASINCIVSCLYVFEYIGCQIAVFDFGTWSLMLLDVNGRCLI